MNEPLLRKKMTTEKERAEQKAWEGDVLDREKLGKTLTPIIKSITQPFVISIGGPYGTGKSWFIQHFQKHLHANGLKTSVYFNAWESDYTEDPLLALIAALDLQLEKSFGEKTKELLKKAVPYITRNLAPALLKAGIGTFLGHKNVEKLVDLPDEIDGAIGEISEKIVSNALQDYKEARSSMMAFRGCLESIVAELNAEKSEEDNREQLIVFVDELDRCRPDYAVKVLECIKHFFNVEGVVFILALDEDQLQEVIKNTYGLGNFGESYLRKFIDLRVNLPKPDTRLYPRALFEAYGMGNIKNISVGFGELNGKDSLLNSFSNFSEYYGLSLRQQTQCFTEINLYIRSLPGSGAAFFPDLLAFLICKRAKHGSKPVGDLCSGKENISYYLDQMLLSMRAELKVRITERFRNDTNRFKANIQIWFYDEDMQNKYKIELEEIISKLKRYEELGITELEQDLLRQRQDYINGLNKHYNNTCSRINLQGLSTADVIFKELEFQRQIQ